MNEKNYTWVFNSTALGGGLDGNFSLEYHIPGRILKTKPADLIGSKLWLVIKNGGSHFLYALLLPSAIELYQEGKYKDDFLVHSEPFGSMRFLPRRESKNPWQVPVSFSVDEGIREIEDIEAEIFRDLIKHNRRISFASPSDSLIESIPKTKFNDLGHAVPDQFMLTLRAVSFGDASRSRSLPTSVSALGGMALSTLKSVLPALDEDAALKLIAALDPLGGAEDIIFKSQLDISKAVASLPPLVDTFLEELDPDKISPRIFVATMTDASFDWLDKTSNAEKIHEGILKDLALRLKEKGFKIYKSQSFDLFAEKGDTHLLWEIKSAHSMNAIAQGEKGILQLLRYSIALSDNGSSGTSLMLLLQNAVAPTGADYLSKMAQRAGATLWLYDEQKDWPHRVFNSQIGDFPAL